MLQCSAATTDMRLTKFCVYDTDLGQRDHHGLSGALDGFICTSVAHLSKVTYLLKCAGGSWANAVRAIGPSGILLDQESPSEKLPLFSGRESVPGDLVPVCAACAALDGLMSEGHS